MVQRIFRYSIELSVILAMAFGFGCSSVPHREFKSYSDAFAETKSVTEQLLLEYDLVKRAEAKSRSAEANPSKLSPPYPSEVNLAHIVHGKSFEDPVNARRDALKVVTGFNSVLISLAEGKKPEEVKSVTDSLIENLNTFATLISEDFKIPSFAVLRHLGGQRTFPRVRKSCLFSLGGGWTAYCWIIVCLI